MSNARVPLVFRRSGLLGNTLVRSLSLPARVQCLRDAACLQRDRALALDSLWIHALLHRLPRRYAGECIVDKYPDFLRTTNEGSVEILRNKYIFQRKTNRLMGIFSLFQSCSAMDNC